MSAIINAFRTVISSINQLQFLVNLGALMRYLTNVLIYHLSFTDHHILKLWKVLEAIRVCVRDLCRRICCQWCPCHTARTSRLNWNKLSGFYSVYDSDSVRFWYHDLLILFWTIFSKKWWRWSSLQYVLEIHDSSVVELTPTNTVFPLSIIRLHIMKKKILKKYVKSLLGP